MDKQEFTLTEESIQLCQLLKVAGLVGTGGEAKHCISEGMVEVDGVVETRKKKQIRSGQVIQFDGTELIVESSPKH